jgi:hypothetical protein
MLTDLGWNCFGDANIGPLCFLSIISLILLSWVEMLLEKKCLRKRVCGSFYGMCGSGNAHGNEWVFQPPQHCPPPAPFPPCCVIQRLALCHRLQPSRPQTRREKLVPSPSSQH